MTVPLLKEDEEAEEEAAAVVAGTGITVACLEGKGASAFPIGTRTGSGRV